MPLTGSALKRVKINTRNRARKRPIRSETKTRIRTAREAMASGDEQRALDRVRAALRQLDRASQRGAIHKRNAARRKSRLQRAYNRTQASGE